MSQCYAMTSYRRPCDGGIVGPAMTDQREETFVKGPVYGTENSTHGNCRRQRCRKRLASLWRSTLACRVDTPVDALCLAEPEASTRVSTLHAGVRALRLI